MRAVYVHFPFPGSLRFPLLRPLPSAWGAMDTAGSKEGFFSLCSQKRSLPARLLHCTLLRMPSVALHAIEQLVPEFFPALPRNRPQLSRYCFSVLCRPFVRPRIKCLWCVHRAFFGGTVFLFITNSSKHTSTFNNSPTFRGGLLLSSGFTQSIPRTQLLQK